MSSNLKDSLADLKGLTSNFSRFSRLGAENKYEPTNEMKHILRSDSKNAKISAFAGTGKTTTLRKYAGINDKIRILYIAFNKSVEQQASLLFSKNTKVMTTHGLGFFHEGKNYVDKINGFVNGKAITDLCIQKEVYKGVKGYNSFLHSKLISETLNSFCASKDLTVNESHVNSVEYEMLSKTGDLNKVLHPQLLAKQATQLWQEMQNYENKNISMTHDGYLKLLQINSPKLNYDMVMLDEAQDSNQSLLHYLSNQDCMRLLVGDKHQSIYGFRGAVNAMDKYSSADEYHLTQSFRFGKNIANLANLVLFYKGETQPLFGLNAHEGNVIRCDSNFKNKEQTAIITRTNFEVFNKAQILIKMNKKIFFVGGLDSYKIADLLDIYNLMIDDKQKIKNPIYRAFNDIDSLKVAAEQAMEFDILAKVNFVKENFKKGEQSFYDYMNNIKGACVENIKDADFILTNTHKSKGLEYDNVILGDDFYFNTIENAKYNEFIKEERMVEEANLLYVALTRAKKNLEIPSQLFDFKSKMDKLLTNNFKGGNIDLKMFGLNGIQTNFVPNFEKYLLNYAVKQNMLSSDYETMLASTKSFKV